MSFIPPSPSSKHRLPSLNLINESKYYPQRPTLQKNDSIWAFCCSDLCFCFKLFSSSWCTRASIVIMYCYLAPLKYNIAIHSTMSSNSQFSRFCLRVLGLQLCLTISDASVSRQWESYVLSETGSRSAHLPRAKQNK